MKVLHMFSNYKLTGPAEPAMRLASELAKRGHDVTFAHQPAPVPGAGGIEAAAARFGLRTYTRLHLRKHWSWLTVTHDFIRLARLINRERYDVIHCHLINDHVTAGHALLWSKHKPRIVRTNHAAVPMELHTRTKFLFPKRTDALIELSSAALKGDAAAFGIPRERLHIVDTAIDLVRFDPARELPDMRTRWSIGPGEFVVGVAARIQRHRRFDILLKAAAIAAKRLSNFRLVLIGRGTHVEAVAVQPARKLGLEQTVVFAGFLSGDEYVGALHALDAKVFLMPGTDGSCRAAREAMALGRPVIAARRGMLPELVTHGTDGLVIDDTPENLAEAMIELAADRDRCRALGAAARQTALRRFDPAKQAEQVEAIYAGLLKPPTSSRAR